MIHLFSLFIALAIPGLSNAITVPFRRQSPPHSTSFNFTNINVGDNEDIYVGTIYLADQPFTVQLDTGSADLWLDTSGLDLTKLPGLINTGVEGEIDYADGSGAKGPIYLGPVQFGDFLVQKQAFISAPGSNAVSAGDKGLLGVGPPGSSRVAQQLMLAEPTVDGASFLDNVFWLYPEEPNYITFWLERDPDLGVTSGGVFTIGEVSSDYAAIKNSTQHEVVDSGVGIPRWSIPMDGMIVNGKSYSGGSAFSHVVGENQTISVLDTGTSLASVPPSYAEAIYKDLPGAELVDGAWVVPCDTKVNISFVFGKDVIPIDPIDATFVHPDGSGGASCIGSFIGVDSSQEGSDFVLGDSFLRNAYALYDFGIWATPGDSNPFIQLLAATDASKAWAQFDTVNAARLAAYGVSLNTTGAKSGSKDGLTNDAAVPTGSSDASSTSSELLRNSYIVIGLLAGVIVSVAALCLLVLRKGKNVGYKPVPNTRHSDRPAEEYDVILPEQKGYGYSDPYEPKPSSR